MTEIDWADIHAKFSNPAGFDVKIRENKYKYIDARDVMDRLDAVVGPENWRQSFRVLDTAACVVECTLIVHDIAKSDVGYPNNPGSSSEKEPFKSAYSDALKRAAVHWGIGRFLYDDDAPPPRQQQQRPAAQLTRAPAAPVAAPKPVSPERRELLDRCKRMAEHARAAGITPPAGITRDSTDAQLEAWHDALAEQINAAIQTEIKELNNAK